MTENINYELVSEMWQYHVNNFNPQFYALNTMN